MLQHHVVGPTDGLFQLHALHGMDQQVLSESLEITPPMPVRVYADPNLNHRFTHLHAECGDFTLRYRATVLRTVEALSSTPLAAAHALAFMLEAR